MIPGFALVLHSGAEPGHEGRLTKVISLDLDSFPCKHPVLLMNATLARKARGIACLLRPFCKSLTTRILESPSTSSRSAHIADFLRRGGANWDSLSTTFASIQLTHSLVEDVLLDLKVPDAKKALTFFHWSSQKHNFLHGLRSYCLLVHILVRAGLLLDARALLESAIENHLTSESSSSSLVEMLWSTYEAVLPGSRVFDLLVQTYSKVRMVELAFDACRYFSDRGFSSSLISFNAVLHAAHKSGRTELAWKVFEYMLGKRVYPNQATVETMISLMCKEGTLQKMISTVDRIHGKRCAPGTIVNASLAFRIFEEGRAEEGILLLKRMLQKNLVFDDIVYSLIIFAYCRMGKLKLAYEQRDDMINRSCNLNVFIYTCFIRAHCDEGDMEESIRLMQEMLSMGLNLYDDTYNYLIAGCSKTGRLEESLAYCENMLKDGFLPNCATCNEMLSTLCVSGQVKKGNELLTLLMDKGFIPNEVTYLKLIDGYGRIKNAQGILNIYYEMEHRGMNPGLEVLTSLIQNLCECGKLKEAEKILIVMRGKSLIPTSCIYDTLITKYCEKGDKKSALWFYDEMMRNKLIPSAYTFMILVRRIIVGKHFQYDRHSQEVDILK
ncbi:uncharacterized protein [Typha latifolia]|uniref:uncharacterized protein n=1 Tax=Typha latifolia TaxID=4733 RepID=UPI003C2F4454